jgi:oligopeptide/dipeptide ABC transporter ATP-binding protein
MSPLLELVDVTKDYRSRKGTGGGAASIPALAGVSLRVGSGESVAVVGESGSGKSTLGRCALRLIEPSSGTIRFDGEDLLGLSSAALRRRRRRFQMVFQDPLGSLDPRQRVGGAVGEVVQVHDGLRGNDRANRIAELFTLVGLDPGLAGQYPHELSGGQRQRIGIARALATSPDLLVADEPVSALDASVRAGILNLFAALQQRTGLALLLIAHDLAMVEQCADQVVVLYLGRIVESGTAERLFALPLHPYTVSLLSAVPKTTGARRERIVLAGEASRSGIGTGCPFQPRCPIARSRCQAEAPPLREAGPGGQVACFYPGEFGGPGQL